MFGFWTKQFKDSWAHWDNFQYFIKFQTPKDRGMNLKKTD